MRTRSTPPSNRRRHRSALALTALLLLPVIGACSTDETDTRAETAGLPSLEVEVGAREWSLDRAASRPVIEGDEPITLTIRDGEAAGTAPCNTFRGGVELDGDALAVGDLATTRMACDEAVLAAEDAFLEALASVTTAEVDDDDRLVLDGDGDVHLVFDGYDADELLVGDWQVLHVGADDTLTGVLEGTGPVLTFAEDGELRLETVCGTRTSAWRLTGEGLAIDDPSSTDATCTEPPGAADQEAALVAALERTRRAEAAPGRLTLLDDRGRIALYAVRTGDGP